MIELKVGRLLELHERLTNEKAYFARAARELGRAEAGHIQVEPRDLRRLADTVSEIEQITALAGLTSTNVAALRTKTFLAQAPLNDPTFAGVRMLAADCGTVSSHLVDICSRIRDDCAVRTYFQIAPENKDLLKPDTDHFGSDVRRAFGGSAEDIAEAAACLALERSTACVFHIMRALEAGVQVIASKIGATVADEHGKGLPWGVIAANMKPKIDKMKKGSNQQIKWYRVQLSLESVNRAYRAPTAHPKETYTPDEARRIFDATRHFMEELASLA